MRPRIKMRRVPLTSTPLLREQKIGINNNLQKFPKVVYTKTYWIDIFYPTNVDRKWFFPYDKALDNCVIKGIRCEASRNTFNGLRPTLVTAFRKNITVAEMVTASLLITLKNKKEEAILENYPLSALTNTDVVRRVNMELDISKCYVHPASEPSLEESLSWVAITLYYTDKNK